jgi:hypothetical protein
MAIVKINDDSSYNHRWIGDVKRIQQVLKNNGYSSLLKDCGDLWDEYSETWCAGWLGLPETDEELWEILESKL